MVEKLRNLSQEVSHKDSLALVITKCEKSAEPIVVKKVLVMSMERRGESN